ncbi:hypothetical protein ACLUWZ_10770 [Limosilactobacillus mucosae]
MSKGKKKKPTDQPAVKIAKYGMIASYAYPLVELIKYLGKTIDKLIK